MFALDYENAHCLYRCFFFLFADGKVYEIREGGVGPQWQIRRT